MSKLYKRTSTTDLMRAFPVLTAIPIFDVTAISNRCDVGFKEYGVKDVEILAEHLFQGEPEEKKIEKKEELLSEWQKLKYNFLQMREDIPPEIAKPTTTTKSPTEWLLERTLSLRSTYDFFLECLALLRCAFLCRLATFSLKGAPQQSSASRCG